MLSTDKTIVENLSVLRLVLAENGQIRLQGVADLPSRKFDHAQRPLGCGEGPFA